jgi:putative flippase GtrA
LRQRILQFARNQQVRFLGVGAINTFVGYGIFAMANEWLFRGVPFGYLLALALSYSLALILAFFLYRRLVFHVRGNVFIDLLRFISVYALSIGVNVVALPFLVEVVHVLPLIAQALILVVTTLVSYFGHRHFSFRRAQSVEIEFPAAIPDKGTPN